MAARSSAATTDSAQRVLMITRVFDAPRYLVFKAWSEPERLVQWFGPKGFTSTVVGSMDPSAWAAPTVFTCAAPVEAITGCKVYIARLWNRSGSYVPMCGRTPTAFQPARKTLLTLTFEADGQKTKLTLHQAVFESVTARDAHEEGWTSSLERLTEYLANPHQPARTV